MDDFLIINGLPNILDDIPRTEPYCTKSNHEFSPGKPSWVIEFWSRRSTDQTLSTLDSPGPITYTWETTCKYGPVNGREQSVCSVSWVPTTGYILATFSIFSQKGGANLPQVVIPIEEAVQHFLECKRHSPDNPRIPHHPNTATIMQNILRIKSSANTARFKAKKRKFF